MKLMQYALEIRKMLMHKINPAKHYFLGTRDLQPISSKFGFDRGTPIDRFWIDRFIKENSKHIKGRVLEIDDSRYSSQYKNDIEKVDVLDINPKNKKANIHGDLRNLKGKISDNTYDCAIITHVLGMIDDVPSAVSEIRRILKPNGVALVTSACLSPVFDEETSYWRFTKAAFKYLFKNGFNSKVETFGNALTGQCFWVGMAQEELTERELEFNDKRFPCVVTCVAIKK